MSLTKIFLSIGIAMTHLVIVVGACAGIFAVLIGLVWLFGGYSSIEPIMTPSDWHPVLNIILPVLGVLCVFLALIFTVESLDKYKHLK